MSRISRVLEISFFLILGSYFLYAGVIKFSNVELFATQIDSYRLIPGGMSFYIAAGLPVYEIVAAILLIPGKTRRVGLFSILFMLTLFCAALASAILRGLEINCGCTGGDEISGWGLYLALFRNVLLATIGIWIYWRMRCITPTINQ
jgi:putative oxidoreductase